jgi:hypothetical protein
MESAPCNGTGTIAEPHALAEPIDAMLMLELLAETPLDPGQGECVYRLSRAARALRELVGEPDAPPPACTLPASTLPAEAPDARSRAAAGQEPLCRIPLLDRYARTAEHLGECLAGVQHAIDCCAGSAEAIEFFRRTRYDLVLADPRFAAGLPAALRAIEKERGDSGHVPVVAL